MTLKSHHEKTSTMANVKDKTSDYMEIDISTFLVIQYEYFSRLKKKKKKLLFSFKS